jgi:hypothetical protein
MVPGQVQSEREQEEQELRDQLEQFEFEKGSWSLARVLIKESDTGKPIGWKCLGHVVLAETGGVGVISRPSDPHLAGHPHYLPTVISLRVFQSRVTLLPL